MAQERRSSQRSGGRVIGLPGQRRGAQPKYGRLDWQPLLVDSTTAQLLWQQFGATEPNAPDTAAVAQPVPVQQDTVPPPPPSVQQPTGTGAQAIGTGTGATPPATPPPTSQPVPTPGAAQKRAAAASPQGIMPEQYRLASLSQQAQRIGIESAMQQVPVPEPVGAQIESGLIPDYTAELQNLIQQWFSIPFQQQGFHLWAAVPTTRGLDAWTLLRQGLQFLKDRLPQLSEQDAQLVSLWADDERLKLALLQESRRLLEEAIVRTPAASLYQNLVKVLKKQEEELQRELWSIPPEERVMANQRFVDLYNRYLKVQNDIMNTAALVAANQGWRINWQNLLDRAAANFLAPVWRILQSQELKVPVEHAVDDVLRRLWNMAKNSDNPHLQRALQYLGQIRKYGGQNLTLWDSERVTQLHREYVAALQQAGLDPETVYSLASVVTKIGTLPGLGWSSGPIVEPAQPIIGFLQPTQLGGAQLPNVEAPVPTSRGGGGGSRRAQPLLVSLRSALGFDRPTVDASTVGALRNSLADLRNVAGAAYLPMGDINWRPILRLLGGKEDAEITFSGARFTPKMTYAELVDNIRKILTSPSQDVGAYTAAVKGDIAQYLRELVASARSSNEDMVVKLDKVRGLFMKRPVEIADILMQAANDPPSLFANFLKQLHLWLRNNPRIENANEVLEALQDRGVREALHAAITAGIARYISLRLGAIAVGRNTITDPQIVPGIAGMILGNLHQIVDFR